MCGIVGGFVPDGRARAGLAALAHRGPDARATRRGDGWILGHARLAVLDLDPRSDQPFVSGDTTISYNGELWNYREVREELRAAGRSFHTEGDTEVVAAALDAWGEDALLRLEGMFAVAWARDREVRLARDRFGEVPLHHGGGCFASELKGLRAMGVREARDVPPGGLVRLRADGFEERRWYVPPARPRPWTREEAAAALRALVERGARERAISDVPACTLLSGGIDSSAVAWALARVIPGLVAFTAVFNPRSRDLRCARLAAEALGVELREVVVPPPTPDDLARVVSVIEMPHKAQVEIGWPCLKLAEAMRAEGFKVTFSGEGSDELWASYGFAYHALQTRDWHEYRRDLFLAQARKNFPRVNKVFMAHGVEARLPFLHTSLVEFALSLPRAAVADARRPKAVMEDAFRAVLPREVVDRPKVAFQDGLGLKRYVEGMIADPRRFYAAEYAARFGA